MPAIPARLPPRRGAWCARDDARMLTLPGDIPLVTSAEIGQLIAAHRPPPSFTIAPSQDERGSNAILISPPDAVTLQLWREQLLPASRRGRGPRHRSRRVVHLPGIALDIDNPADLAHFARLGSQTRAGRLVAEIEQLRDARGAGLGGRE